MRGQSHWSDEEKRYLLRNRSDGYAPLAVALQRSEKAVRRQAERMGLRLKRKPDAGELCPRCATYRIRPKAKESYRAGLCPVCWEHEKAHALEERTAFQRERRAYERAKYRAKAERSRAAD